MESKKLKCLSCNTGMNAKSNYPITLPCRDVICLDCVKKLVEDSGTNQPQNQTQEIKCPTCSKVDKVDLGFYEAIAKSYIECNS